MPLPPREETGSGTRGVCWREGSGLRVRPLAAASCDRVAEAWEAGARPAVVWPQALNAVPSCFPSLSQPVSHTGPVSGYSRAWGQGVLVLKVPEEESRLW